MYCPFQTSPSVFPPPAIRFLFFPLLKTWSKACPRTALFSLNNSEERTVWHINTTVIFSGRRYPFSAVRWRVVYKVIDFTILEIKEWFKNRQKKLLRGEAGFSTFTSHMCLWPNLTPRPTVWYDPGLRMCIIYLKVDRTDHLTLDKIRNFSPKYEIHPAVPQLNFSNIPFLTKWFSMPHTMIPSHLKSFINEEVVSNML